MSVKSTLARKAVKTTAKHTAHGAASKAARKPLRSVTLLTVGALAGALAGWLIGRSGSGNHDPIAQAPVPTSVVTNSNSTEKASETGAVS